MLRTTSRRIFLSLLGGIFLFAAGHALAESSDPEAVVNAAASSVQEALQGKQDYYSDNPDELYGVVNDVLLPHFDVRYAGYLVLGDHWRPASEEQRNRFIDAFYGFLVRSYAKGMLEFDQDQLSMNGSELNEKGNKAIVRTELTLADGSSVPVNYSMRLGKSGDWKVYDVRIEGISYVQNYRNQFNAEIRAQGLDAVIARLETDSEDPAVKTQS